MDYSNCTAFWRICQVCIRYFVQFTEKLSFMLAVHGGRGIRTAVYHSLSLSIFRKYRMQTMLQTAQIVSVTGNAIHTPRTFQSEESA